jgi:hypothetical protein
MYLDAVPCSLSEAQIFTGTLTNFDKKSTGEEERTDMRRERRRENIKIREGKRTKCEDKGGEDKGEGK